jgi:predicted membrane-bound mannosyltransferase
MKAEKSVAIFYTLLGIALGVVSNYLANIYLAILIPLIAYALTLPALLKFTWHKKKKFIPNSLVSFLLWWFVVWILLINIR